MAGSVLDALLGKILDNGTELEGIGGLNLIGFDITPDLDNGYYNIEVSGLSGSVTAASHTVTANASATINITSHLTYVSVNVTTAASAKTISLNVGAAPDGALIWVAGVDAGTHAVNFAKSGGSTLYTIDGGTAASWAILRYLEDGATLSLVASGPLKASSDAMIHSIVADPESALTVDVADGVATIGGGGGTIEHVDITADDDHNVPITANITYVYVDATLTEERDVSFDTSAAPDGAQVWLSGTASGGDLVIAPGESDLFTFVDGHEGWCFLVWRASTETLQRIAPDSSSSQPDAPISEDIDVTDDEDQEVAITARLTTIRLTATLGADRTLTLDMSAAPLGARIKLAHSYSTEHEFRWIVANSVGTLWTFGAPSLYGPQSVELVSVSSTDQRAIGNGVAFVAPGEAGNGSVLHTVNQVKTGGTDMIYGPARGSNLADSDETIAFDSVSQYWTSEGTPLTANRTKTLDDDPAPPFAGFVARIVQRQDVAFTLAIVNGGPGGGTLFTFPASTRTAADFQWDGTDWSFAGATVIA